MDSEEKTLALGTRTGKILVWDLDVEHPSDIRYLIVIYRIVLKPAFRGYKNVQLKHLNQFYYPRDAESRAKKWF